MKNTNRLRAAPLNSQKPTPARFETHADIVANAQVHDYCSKLVDELDSHTRGVIAAAQMRGCRLVSINWITGQFALALCKPGTRTPTSKNIVIAYRACRRAAKHSQGAAS